MKILNKTSVKFILGFAAIVAVGLIFLSAVGYYEDYRSKLNPSPESNLADPKGN